MARGALRLGVIAVPLVAALGYLAHGGDGAASAALGLGIAVINFAVAAAVSALAGRHSPTMAAFVGLPSYAVRMVAVLGLLAGLQGRSFIVTPVFAVAFGAGIAAVLAYECAVWARTPWIGLAFKEKP